MEHLTNGYFWMWCIIVFLQTQVTMLAIVKGFEAKLKTPAFIFAGAFFCILPMIAVILLTGEENWVKTILVLLLPIVFASLFTNGSKSKIVMFYVGCLVIDTIIELLLYFLVSVFALESGDTIGVFNGQRAMLTLFSLMIMTPAKYLYVKMWNRIINKQSRKKGTGLYLIFPVAQIIVFFVVIFECIHEDIDESMGFMLLLAAFILVAISDMAFLHYIADIEKKNRLELEIADMEYKHSIEAEHYRRIEEKRYELAKIRHDFKNQLAAVRKLLESGNRDSAEELFYEIDDSLNNTIEEEYCSIPVINAVISEKQALLKEHSIEFTASVSVDETGRVSQNHLCSIFANLIDNAVKANIELEAGEKRYINLQTACRGGVIAVKTVNPCKWMDDTKISPAESKGYGLKIIRDIAERYDGRFNIEIKNGVCTAVVTINTAE